MKIYKLANHNPKPRPLWDGHQAAMDIISKRLGPKTKKKFRNRNFKGYV